VDALVAVGAAMRCCHARTAAPPSLDHLVLPRLGADRRETEAGCPSYRCVIRSACDRRHARRFVAYELESRRPSTGREPNQAGVRMKRSETARHG
jgi:hypothetical protein